MWTALSWLVLFLGASARMVQAHYWAYPVMRKLLILLLLMISLSAVASIAAVTTDDLQAKCESEGGCLLITQRAFDHLVREIGNLHRIILATRKEQCT